MATRARLTWECGHVQFVDLYGGRIKQLDERERLLSGPCPVCGHVAEARDEGAQDIYGSTEHQAVAPKVMTNRRGQRCERCGRWVEAGDGHLYYGGDEHESHEPGWRVYCKDTEGCRQAQKEREDSLTRRAAAYRPT